MKHATYSQSFTISTAELQWSRLRALLHFLLRLNRSTRNSHELLKKQLAWELTGKKQYHHGDLV